MTGAGTGGESPVAGRPGTRWAWLAVTVLSALCVVGPAGVEAWAWFSRETVTTGSVDRHRIEVLEIDAGGASVTVDTGPAGEVTVRQESSWSLRKPTVRRAWDGDTLKVRAECGYRVWSPTSLGCRVALDFAVPPRTAVRVLSSSGSIAVRGVAGDPDLENTSGSTELTSVGGHVFARTTSGTFRASAITSRTVDVGAGSGMLEPDFAVPPQRVTASVGSGALSVTVPVGSRYRVTGETGSGSRDVAPWLADVRASRTIDATSGSGSIELRYPGRP